MPMLRACVLLGAFLLFAASGELQSGSLPMLRLSTGSYYFHSGDSGDRVNWVEALHWCETRGLQLLSIETAEEDRLVRRVISGSNTQFWTSGNDLVTEGEWVWHSTGRPFNLTGWGSGEPNNGASTQPSEGCMFIGDHSSTKQNHWFDAPCMRRFMFICEQPLLDPGCCNP